MLWASTFPRLPFHARQARWEFISFSASLTGGLRQPAIRLWAHEDEFERAHVEKVDAVRYKFVPSVFQAVTGEDQRSRLMADLLLAFMIGSITALPRMPAERVLGMTKEFKRLYGLDGRTGVML